MRDALLATGAVVVSVSSFIANLIYSLPPIVDSSMISYVFGMFFIGSAVLFAVMLAAYRLGWSDKEQTPLSIVVLGTSGAFLFALPLGLGMVDKDAGVGFLLDSSCRDLSYRDYHWYLLDSLAKGAVLDFLESFDINLWTCPPRKTPLVGLITFAIRTCMTTLSLWLLVHWWRSISIARRDSPSP